jgi:predicted DCC family thiol-disulfide oxidoreductase YuxK
VVVDRAVILYDDDCGFCRWSVSKVLAWDRHARLRPLTLQSDEADSLLSEMNLEQRMASWHLVGADGTVHSAGRAVGPLAGLLPAGAPIAAIASALPGATEAAYRWVARHRDGLGRLVGAKACSVRPADRAARVPPGRR